MPADGASDSDAFAADSDGPDESVDTGPPIRGTARATVTHYFYHFDIAATRAVSQLTLTTTSPGDCLAIPFRSGAVAEDVVINDVPARDPVVESDVLIACDPADHGWPIGSTLVLGATSRPPSAPLGPTQVGYTTRPDRAGRRFAYMLSWVGECDRQGPCDSTPGLFATYRFAVDHAMGTRVLCPGTITAMPTHTVCDFNFAGGPTYSTFFFVAGQSWTETPLGTSAGVQISLFDIPASGVGAAIDAGNTLGFLQWMTDTFGTFPYGDRLRIIVGPTYWSGFEHPGNIVIAESLAPENVNHTVTHEIAHQWAGDQATVASTADFVWKEAMAEYLSFVWEDENRGHDVALVTSLRWRSASRSLREHPIPATAIPLFSHYNSAYGPGPMVLFRQLEVMYSRAAVLRALRTLLGRPRSLSVTDVRIALETALGVSLVDYVDRWLKGSGPPVWPTVSMTGSIAAMEPLTFRVAFGDGRYRACRFTVRLRGAVGEQQDLRFDLGLDGRGMLSQTVTPTFVVQRVEVDPDGEALVFGDASIPVAPGGIVSTIPSRFWIAP